MSEYMLRQEEIYGAYIGHRTKVDMPSSYPTASHSSNHGPTMFKSRFVELQNAISHLTPEGRKEMTDNFIKWEAIALAKAEADAVEEEKAKIEQMKELKKMKKEDRKLDIKRQKAKKHEKSEWKKDARKKKKIEKKKLQRQEASQRWQESQRRQETR